MKGIKGVFHTGITVKNLENSVKFYRDIVGLELVLPPTEEIKSEDTDKGIGLNGITLRVAVFKVGNSSLELLEYKSPESQLKESIKANDLGAMHVAFEVEDIYEKKAEMEKQGVVFNSEPMIIEEGPLKGWKWVYFKDPDGITMELVEYKQA